MALGLLPAAERRGRVGVYRPAHQHRLALIGRLQERGHSLAGIRDLLTSWHDGDELADILGLSPDELVHLDDLVAVGVIDHCGPDRYCVPSPSLLQLTVDALAAGFTPKAVLSLLTAVHDAAQLVAGAAHTLITRPPAGIDQDRLEALATRGRGLLAHGTGRLGIYTLGQRLDHDAPGRRARHPR